MTVEISFSQKEIRYGEEGEILCPYCQHSYTHSAGKPTYGDSETSKIVRGKSGGYKTLMYCELHSEHWWYLVHEDHKGQSFCHFMVPELITYETIMKMQP